MRWLALALVGVAACGRSGFNAVGDGGDDAISIDALDDPHYQVAPGWKLELLVDLTGTVPYLPADFMDGTDEVLGNAPVSIAALYTPFAGELAVSYGRSVLEVNADRTSTLHDFRPAVPDTTGPDSIYRMSFGAPPDTGAMLFVGSASQGNGDGLYTISPGWQLVRDNSNNNVDGVAFDPTGAFDSIGTPTVYFLDSNGVERRDSATSTFNIYLNTANDYDALVLSDTALFFVDEISVPSNLERCFETTHVVQTVASSSSFSMLEGGPPASTSIAAIRDSATLTVYANDGTSMDLASSTDPAWVWIHGSAPQPPHQLANSYVILESNRTLDRDRLLVISPE